jgi:opacity protein-like surface antigen
MMGKFATASALTLLALIILLGAPGFAQTTPAGQMPAAQQPATATPTAQQPDSSQEPADEASTLRRKKPKDYKNWTFNVGAGANVNSGSTKNFVRGGGVGASAGAARNFNKYFGLRADFIWDQLPLRQSALGIAQAQSASNNAYSVTFDPIINIPVTSLYSGYVLFGAAFVHRVGHLDSSTAIPGSGCNPFWSWWGACVNSNAFIPLDGSFATSSLNQFGYNVGAGVTRKMPSGVEIYAEYRLMHGTHDNVQTDFRPITIGVRW